MKNLDFDFTSLAQLKDGYCGITVRGEVVAVLRDAVVCHRGIQDVMMIFEISEPETSAQVAVALFAETIELLPRLQQGDRLVILGAWFERHARYGRQVRGSRRFGSEWFVYRRRACASTIPQPVV